MPTSATSALNTEEMFLSSVSQYPVERTLLTGAFEAALTSRYEGHVRLDTPWLDVAYRSFDRHGDRPRRHRWDRVWSRIHWHQQSRARPVEGSTIPTRPQSFVKIIQSRPRKAQFRVGEPTQPGARCAASKDEVDISSGSGYS